MSSTVLYKKIISIKKNYFYKKKLIFPFQAQYEFVHRAIVNYADLHRLSLDLPSDC